MGHKSQHDFGHHGLTWSAAATADVAFLGIKPLLGRPHGKNFSKVTRHSACG